jgi:subtilisin family serine protease
VKVAVVDSGVHAAHPHVNGVAGGVCITRDGREEGDYTDSIGHGTAVTAVIREKAPNAELFAVKIFHDRLAARIDLLVHAIDWSVRHGMDLINLSLGTDNPAHEPALRAALGRANDAGVSLVAAYGWLPGSLPGAISVELDWECPRMELRTGVGGATYRASGYPRPIPGVPVERNLQGISFAVANVTGLLARGEAKLG